MMKKFIFEILVYTFPIMCLFIGWNYFVQNSTWNNFGILKFQVEKLKQNQNKHFNYVFIGDSSGGNAINTEGLNALNLCLTGSFGFVGNHEFLNVVNQYVTYDTLVIINNLGIFSRTDSEKAKWIPNIYSNNLYKRIKALASARDFAKPLFHHYRKHGFEYRSAEHTKDYFVSNKVTPLKQNNISDSIKTEKIIEFKKMLRLAGESSKVKIYFFLGPTLPYSKKYFNQLKTSLNNHKIHYPIYPPFLLDEKTKGSSEHHINRKFSKYSTRFYLNQMRKSKPIMLVESK